MITKSEINEIKSLKDKNSRLQLSMFVTEGEKMFEEIFYSSFSINRILYIKENVSNETLSKIKSLFEKNICEIIEVSPKEMQRITHLKTETPILVCVEIPQTKLIPRELKNQLTIALDNVQDPGNLGTILRIADWFGIKNIICSPDTVDVFNPKVIQASMGAVTRVKVHYQPLKNILTELKSEDMPIYGTFLDGDIIQDKKLSNAVGVIVMGNEGNGISDEIAQIVTDRLFIPPYPMGAPTSESLNVAVATAIICNEFRRATR